MTPLRHPAPDRTTGAALANTDNQADTTLAARRNPAGRNAAAGTAQPHAAIPDSNIRQVLVLAGGRT